MPERLLSVTETLRRCGYQDKGTLLRLAKQGHFPQSVRLNPYAANSAIAFKESEVQAWIDSRPYGGGKALPREAYSKAGRPRKVVPLQNFGEQAQPPALQLVPAPAPAAPVVPRIKLIKRA